MLRPHASQVLFLALAALTLPIGRSAYGVNPNALQSAYWRFEEGIADGYVAANPPADPQNVLPDTVLDSINDNRMKAHNTATAPKYINYSLPPTNLKSGVSNTLAWEVDGSATGGRDVYTSDNEKIQNGVVGGMFDPDGSGPSGVIANYVTGFTLEAAFSVFDYSSFRSIIAKEGRPGLEQNEGDANFQALPTMALKVRGPLSEGDPEQGKLQIELFDGAGDLKSVSTNEALTVGQWYYAAVVNDGATLSLYLNKSDGGGYVLEGSVPVDGALFQGLNRNNANWNYNWTIGRATYGGVVEDLPNNPGTFIPNKGGAPSDWFNGLIDEVRLTNKALAPSQFLFAPPGLAGDFNGDDRVDGADFLEWQRGYSPIPFSASDLAEWQDHFGMPAATIAAGVVPEPAALSMAGLAIGAVALVRRRQHQSSQVVAANCDV